MHRDNRRIPKGLTETFMKGCVLVHRKMQRDAAWKRRHTVLGTPVDGLVVCR